MGDTRRRRSVDGKIGRIADPQRHRRPRRRRHPQALRRSRRLHLRPRLHLDGDAARASITFIDGDKGVLLHRGYPIDQLAEKSSFLEVCYLLLNGELPTAGPVRQRSSSNIT